MGLRLKFNLVLIGVFAIGLAACAADCATSFL
jgi:hypothetical protein